MLLNFKLGYIEQVSFLRLDVNAYLDVTKRQSEKSVGASTHPCLTPFLTTKSPETAAHSNICLHVCMDSLDDIDKSICAAKFSKGLVTKQLIEKKSLDSFPILLVCILVLRDGICDHKAILRTES